MNYSISVGLEAFNRIHNYSQPEPEKLSYILSGNEWYTDLIRFLQTTENHSHDLKPTVGRVNPESKKVKKTLFYIKFRL